MSDFKINEAYAEKYNTWRRKEELQKLKDKYGESPPSESESSSSETEDEDAEALTEQLEKDWLTTLSSLRNKDPRIYQKDATFYHTDTGEESSSSSDRKKKKRKKEKPVYLKDYERKLIVEREGQLSDNSDSDERPGISEKSGYFEEQQSILKSIKAAAHSSDDSSSEEEFLVKRTKSQAEQEEETSSYTKWLSKQKKNTDKKVGIELDSVPDVWNKPSLDEGEKFLRDYILKKQYLEKDSDRIPTYEEIVDDGEGFSEEEEILEKQETFERKFNFRFEEPDQEFIKSYPRTIDHSIRRKDTKRAEKRKEIKERKLREKEQKKEELKQLKSLKRKEIEEKISRLKEITGNEDIGFKEEDLEEDFDPQKHDEMMKKYFNDDYYEAGDEEQKPDVGFDDEDLQIDNWDMWQGETTGDSQEDWDEGEPYADDPDFVMDADYDPSRAPEKDKKKKKKSKFAQVLSKKKPVFDPNEKTFEEYFDEYYKLDYEDIIGDMPCRFRYRQTTSNNFGLTADEILKCRDKELNAWASLKKMSQYRTEEEELAEVRIYQQKGKNLKKKLNILTSLREQDSSKKGNDNQTPGPSHTETMQSIREKKRKRQDLESDKVETDQSESDKKKKKRKKIDKFENTSPLTAGTSGGNESKRIEMDVGNSVSERLNSEDMATVMKNTILTTDSGGPTSNTTGQKEVSEKGTAPTSFKKKKKKKQTATDSGGPSSSTSGEKDVSEKETFSTNVKKKKKKKQKALKVGQNSEGRQGQEQIVKKKKKKKGGELMFSEERLKAYGINPKTFKYTQKDKAHLLKKS